MPENDQVLKAIEEESRRISRILIVDDEEDILDALNRELENQSFEITTLTDPFAALEEIRKEQYSLIISDNKMPGMTGIELFEQVKNICPDTVRILLTGYADLESAIDAINKGEIHRFIAKPWDRDQLLEHVRQGLESSRLKQLNYLLAQELKVKNDDLIAANAELKNLAIRDQMTSLYNHAEFQRSIDRQIKLFRRDRQPFCLALGDIDDFKNVNDTYGHPTGDDVIITVARIFLDSLREEVDTSYRYGGEEFALILRNTNDDAGELVVARTLKQIAERVVETSAGDLSVTMSFGVGQYLPDWSKEDFVSKVDQALYHAKRTGKNRVQRVSALSASEAG